MDEENNLRLKIEKFFNDNPEEPFSVSQIANNFNFKRNTVHYHLKILKERAFLCQNDKGDYFLQRETESDFVKCTLGKRFKQVFTAFLISSIVPIFQAWLWKEYNKLSKDMAELGTRNGSIEVSKVSNYFKTASRLTLAFFASVISYVTYYAIFLIIRTWRIPVVYATVIDALAAILMAILACGISVILRKAWNAALASSIANNVTKKDISLVVSGVNCNIVSSIMITIFFSTLPIFIFNYPLSLVGKISQYPSFIALFLSDGVLVLASIIIGSIGLANQAKGIFSLARSLQSEIS
ncbi:MAG TPA: helix-turn-helix domain-containing protein [Candidatus Lokiarchaeia archaeon]|nr:helix-turn-helix domain-containing protein [Candidatus Lokiarchaeia archaeon]